MIRHSSHCWFVPTWGLWVVLAYHKAAVYTFVPPHPQWHHTNDTAWKIIEKRTFDDDKNNNNNNNINNNNNRFKYQPVNIHPALCRHVDDSTCQEVDHSFLEHTQRSRSLVEAGSLRTLVLLLQWEDHNTRELIDPSEIDMLWNADLRSKAAPSGSIASYLRLNSYGKFHIQADVIPWIMTTGTEEYYANATSGLPNERDVRKAIEPLLNHLDTPDFDWSRYDQDLDGLIDSLIVMHSGYGAELGGVECGATDKDASKRIWSHSQGALPQSWYSSHHDISLGGFTITSAYGGLCGEEVAHIGIILHELLHSMGLPYLYDLSRPMQNGRGVGGVGSFDIMANPYGPSENAMYPGMLSPWSKMQLGWLEPFKIPYDGIYLAGASAAVDQVYMISQGFARGEYLLIENRQAVLFDSQLPTPTGILIWHIDESRSGNDNPGYPGQEPQNSLEPLWPRNGRHYKVALVQADGLYELEKGVNNGDSKDFWFEGMELRPGIHPNPSYPNSDGYAFGEIIKTGLIIKILSPSGNKMRFEVTGIGDWSEVAPTDEFIMIEGENMTVRTPWGPMLYKTNKDEEESSNTTSTRLDAFCILVMIGLALYSNELD